jgi:hypothetical protein
VKNHEVAYNSGGTPAVSNTLQISGSWYLRRSLKRQKHDYKQMKSSSKNKVGINIFTKKFIA